MFEFSQQPREGYPISQEDSEAPRDQSTSPKVTAEPGFQPKDQAVRLLGESKSFPGAWAFDKTEEAGVIEDRGEGSGLADSSLLWASPAAAAILREQEPCCGHVTWAGGGRRERPGKKPLAGGTGDEGIRGPGSDSAGSQGGGLDLDHVGLKKGGAGCQRPFLFPGCWRQPLRLADPC